MIFFLIMSIIVVIIGIISISTGQKAGVVVGIIFVIFGASIATMSIEQQVKPVIDFPEEPIEKGNLLIVEDIRKDSVFLAYYHLHIQETL